MTIELRSADIVALAKLAGFAEVDLSGLRFEPNRVRFEMSTPLGRVRLAATVELLQEGVLEVDLTEASVAGFSAFGVVRKEAASVLLDHIRAYRSYVKAYKAANGNLRFQLVGSFAKLCLANIALDADSATVDLEVV